MFSWWSKSRINSRVRSFNFFSLGVNFASIYREIHSNVIIWMLEDIPYWRIDSWNLWIHRRPQGKTLTVSFVSFLQLLVLIWSIYRMLFDDYFLACEIRRHSLESVNWIEMKGFNDTVEKPYLCGYMFHFLLHRSNTFRKRFSYVLRNIVMHVEMLFSCV